MRRILPIIIMLLALAGGIGLGYHFALDRRVETGPTAVLAILDPRVGGGVLVSSTEGQHFLVDPGPAVEAGRLASWLRDSGIEEVTLVLTNSSARRAGSVERIARSIRIRRILRATIDEDGEWARQLAATREQRVPEITLTGDDRVVLTKTTTLRVLSPPKGLLQTKKNSTETNSLVVQFVIGRVKYLLMSDAGLETESYLMRSGADLASDIMVIGRFGAEGATSLELLAVVRPQNIVVPGSTAAQNANRDVLKRIAPDVTGAKLYRPDINGTAKFTTDGSSARVSNEY